jgi:hypothetical protein
MKLIKLIKKTSHKTEQMEVVISILCMVAGVKLSETDIRVLAFYVVHGIKESTDSLIINSGVTTFRVLGNIKAKLLRLGFLKRTKELYKSYELNLSEGFPNDKEINILIKIDNS